MKIKLPDIVTKREFMKNVFRLKNYPVEFHNISVKHDMTIDERAKEKELYGISKENNKDSNLLWDQKVIKGKKKKKISPVEGTLNS